MNTIELRNLYTAAPFQRFEIVLANGTAVPVVHPEFLSFAPDGKTVHVYQPDGSAKYIDVRLIIALNTAKNGASARKRKR